MKVSLFTNATILDATFDMIASIDKSDFSQEHIIVVPDKYSLLAEKNILSLLGESLFNVRVLGLTKLADEILKNLGVKCEVVTEAESLLLTQKAIDEVSDNFKVFKRGDFSFCQEMNKLIGQLKSSCVDSCQLAVEGGTLSNGKYHDIQLVYDKYTEFLGGRLDANGKLLLASKFANSECLKDKHYYFGYFEAFTAEGFVLLESLIKFAQSISFACASPITIGNDYLYDNDIKEKLVRLCTQNSISIDVKLGCQKFSPTKTALLKGVLSYDRLKIDNDGFYTLLGAGNIEEEVEFVGRMIFYLTQIGYSYSDIGVCVSDISKYQPAISRIFDKFNFVYFLDNPITADKTLIVRAIKSLFVVEGGGYQKNDLVALFLNPLFDSQDLAGRVLQKEICGKMGYKKHLAGLFRYNHFLDALDKCRNVKDYVNFVRMVLSEIKEPFNEFWLTQNESYLKEESIDRQAFALIDESLNLLEKYDTIITGEEFISRFDGLLHLPLSSTPTFIDGLNVLDATSSSMENKKVLFILGAQDLPVVAGEGGLLSDEELKENTQKEISPTIRMINRRNRFKLFTLLSTANEKLVLTYQMLNDEGKKNELPAYISSLNQIFDIREEKISIFLKSGLTFNDGKLLSMGNRACAIEENWKFAKPDREFLGIDKKITASDRDNFSGDSKALFFSDGKFSASELESYFSCPFKHFVRYGLNLKDSEKVDISPIDIGNICHKMAELFVIKFPKGCKANAMIKIFILDNFDDVIEQLDLQTKLEESEDKSQKELFIKKYLTTFLRDVSRELFHSSMTPLPPEKTLSAFKVGMLTLKGRADRVDISDNYFKIVDYKTGKTKDILKELYFGNKLQLFLYANSVGKETGLTCGGVFYFNAKFDYATSDEDKKLLKGLVRNDPSFIPLLDYDIDAEGKSEILSIERSADDKKGKYKGRALASEDFSVYLNYASAVAKKGIEEIEEGFIQPKPCEGACSRCGYRGICLFSSDKGARQTNDRVSFEN